MPGRIHVHISRQLRAKLSQNFFPRQRSGIVVMIQIFGQVCADQQRIRRRPRRRLVSCRLGERAVQQIESVGLRAQHAEFER